MKNTNINTKIIISGGGTGGHIFPAIAIANEIKLLNPNAEILFVGAKDKMEMQKVPMAGYNIKGLWISGLDRKISFKNLLFPLKIIVSIIKSLIIIHKFKPHIVVGVGGFASGPLLYAAYLKRIPSLIQEQNSYPGITNKILANKVNKICVAYPNMNRFFPESKIILTGNPVRQELLDAYNKKQEAFEYFKLDKTKKIILVIGGSLGARTINETIFNNLNEFVNNNLQLIWQTGINYFSSVKNIIPKYENQGIRIFDFINRMDLAYAISDIVISRAGAIAISEISLLRKPAIFVPSPNVAEDHQTKNALALVEQNAAIMIKDVNASKHLVPAAINLINDESKIKLLVDNISKFAFKNSTNIIAKEIIKLINPNFNDKSLKSILDYNTIYFLGIGGIGMSALARYFKAQGKIVAGYDKTETILTQQLINEGINVNYSLPLDNKDFTKNIELIIYTPAIIESDKVVFNYFANSEIPMIKRSEALGKITENVFTIAIAGTHGKTTITTMIAHILKCAELNITAFMGGISANYNSNILLPNKTKDNNIVVVEADEYDKSFLTLNPDIEVITSMDADHLDIYGTQENLKQNFNFFLNKLKPDGKVFIKKGLEFNGNAIHYALKYSEEQKSKPDVYAENIRLSEQNNYIFDYIGTQNINDIKLHVNGLHNIENMIAAIAVAQHLGVQNEKIKKGVETYLGVKRRFEYIINNKELIFIDDYAHHPEEIRTTINAIRQLYKNKKLLGIFQPHLFSRTRDFADDFANSLGMLDELILLDIYPARELPIEGINSKYLLNKISLSDKQLYSKEELLQNITNHHFDIILTIGAGDIDKLIEPLKNKLLEKLVLSNA